MNAIKKRGVNGCHVVEHKFKRQLIRGLELPLPAELRLSNHLIKMTRKPFAHSTLYGFKEQRSQNAQPRCGSQAGMR